MNILFLGNSFTFFNDMPGLLAERAHCDATMLVRGGAFLHQFLDPADPLCPAAESLLKGVEPHVESPQAYKRFGAGRSLKWDYVVLQEQSYNAVGNRQDYLCSVSTLCEKVRAAGAQPVIYATWPYRAGSEKLAATGSSWEGMRIGLYEANHEAARKNHVLCADAGAAMLALGDRAYAPDAFHPSPEGSAVIAKVLQDTILGEKIR